MGFVSLSLKHIKREWAWQKKYNRLAPAQGEPAPDFELFDITGQQRVRLSDFCDQKPVALIFGSFT